MPQWKKKQFNAANGTEGAKINDFLSDFVIPQLSAATLENAESPF